MMLRAVLCSLVVLSAVVAQASDPVMTSQLPAGLEAIGVTASDVVTQADAQQVRGQTVAMPDLKLWQEKTFSLVGSTLAQGSSVNLLEGLIGQISVTSTTAGAEGSTVTTIDALFGGLSGNVSVTTEGLNFDLAGKALQETLNLQGGLFNQDFTQWYKKFQ